MIPSESFPNNLPPGWKALLQDEIYQDYFMVLTEFLKEEYQVRKTIYPARPNILRALQMVDYEEVKVVILGQDPYHGAGQAIGLCFAVPNDLLDKPPSLQNIFKEIESDLKIKLDFKRSDLTGWVEQGVLLLNTVLTVRAGQAFSHRERGWEIFTDKIIHLLNGRKEPLVFLLWGAAAQKKSLLISNKHHFLLKAAHPSPFSVQGFLGCHHFSQTNEILKNELQISPIDWARTSSS